MNNNFTPSETSAFLEKDPALTFRMVFDEVASAAMAAKKGDVRTNLDDLDSAERFTAFRVALTHALREGDNRAVEFLLVAAPRFLQPDDECKLVTNFNVPTSCRKSSTATP